MGVLTSFVSRDAVD
ncbi:hypothetical protein, partial [Frankia casuarinae]